ncbi:MAG: DNA polymerase III subunit gamma/tau [Bacillota bacterium]|nr:DNA polymerase III subunit gamma/tau [Bacillota bacterium]
MYTALYRVYRPEVFDQLLGQEHIVRILKNQIAAESTSHAYLFCGTRGTGKTTTARLLAKGLNCLSRGERPCGECSACRAIRDGSFLDVIEIDAASNRGIDEIRELRESVNYPPVMGRKKVYIIDEVHMMTSEAFNALLKTLEEPPEYVTFILATTEVRKLPATILSRCMRLDFRRIPEQTIMSGMRRICRDIGIDVTDSALRIIAANADGSVRDGLSILDQCIAGGEKTVDGPDVLEFLGASGEEVFVELTDLVTKGRTAEALQYLAEVLADGKDVRQLIRDWINHYRSLLMTRYIRDPREVINLSVENIDRIRSQSAVMEPDDINRGILELSKTMNEARWSTQPRILLELCIVTLCRQTGAIRAAAGAEPAAKATPGPAVTGETAAPDPKPEAPEPAEAKPAEPPAAPGPERAAAPVKEELQRLWDDIFAAGAASKGSMHLIRSNTMLTAVDEHTFTVIVPEGMMRRHTENNRDLLENLMENRTGVRRRMQVEVSHKKKEEISAEEAAANAARVLGADVEIR